MRSSDCSWQVTTFFILQGPCVPIICQNLGQSLYSVDHFWRLTTPLSEVKLIQEDCGVETCSEIRLVKTLSNWKTTKDQKLFRAQATTGLCKETGSWTQTIFSQGRKFSNHREKKHIHSKVTIPPFRQWYCSVLFPVKTDSTWATEYYTH